MYTVTGDINIIPNLTLLPRDQNHDAGHHHGTEYIFKGSAARKDQGKKRTRKPVTCKAEKPVYDMPLYVKT